MIDVIESGYKIPFIFTPPPFFAKNNRSSLEHPEFVQSAIAELLSNRCIFQVHSPPFCCNPLTVATEKKLRLVLDLRHPNKFVLKTKFKYEDLKHISQVLDFNQHYFSFDLESGYHHIDIFSEHHKYLGFSWRFHQFDTRYYVFRVLPFGLTSACYLFTKLTRPLVHFWRALGISCFMYIDGLIISPDRQSALHNSAIVKDSLIHSGLVPSKTKCFWHPQNTIKYLGLLLDSRSLTFSVPTSKMSKLLSTIQDIVHDHAHSKPIQARSLARITGQLISMSLALGPVTRLMTRAMYRSIESRASWCDSIVISDSVITELTFWQSNFELMNGFSITHQHAPARAVHSDASDTGYGGYVAGFKNQIINGTWSETEKTRSSTWRELAAVFKILLELRDELAHLKIRWYTDNANVPRILAHGSPKPDLQALSLSIFLLCLKHNIVILPEWIPRNINRIADSISRVFDFDDWSIDQSSFDLIDRLWGPHTWDRFASPTNFKVNKFNSRFWCRGSSGVDAFCHTWSDENNYLCPPVSLIANVLKHLSLYNGRGTLIIPRWTSAYFWPSICPDGKHFINSVHDWRLLSIWFTPPTLAPNSVFNRTPTFLSLALRIDHTVPPITTHRGFCSSDLGYRLFATIIDQLVPFFSADLRAGEHSRFAS